ncbi:rod shape-determining protein MreD [Candidatus Avelusimicrobium aviculae]|uniref:rod shape-determining protein MreD n=1 Tax=Candidatus Avelusimicrobium aviculae TaxID=3416206 RepID=UPI003D0D0B50
MWGFFKLFIAFVGATVFHWAFATAFANIGIQVSVMLVFVVACCTLLKPAYGYPMAFLCGLFLDFFGTKLFGNNAFTFCLLATFVYMLSERFDFESILPQMVSVFCLSVFAILFNALLLMLFSASAFWQGFWSLFAGSVINALMAPLVFFVLRMLLSKGFVSKEA